MRKMYFFLIGMCVSFSSFNGVHAQPKKSTHHSCLDSLHSKKLSFSEARLNAVKNPKTDSKQLEALESHMNAVEQLERVIASGHPLTTKDCDVIIGQVNNLTDLMNKLAANGKHLEAKKSYSTGKSRAKPSV